MVKPEAHEPRTGLALLPPPSELDAFFDMEGFPLVDNGLEYLWGVIYLQNGERQFVDWWAHDPADEKAAFEAFIDWAYARWKANPAMHIYHYAAYEKSAVRRLGGRYATRDDEVAACKNSAIAAVAAPVKAAATRLFARVAGLRLGAVQLSGSFAPVGIKPEVATETVEISNLSAGEQEQLFLIIRLALGQVLAKSERQLVVLAGSVQLNREPPSGK